MNKKRKFVTMSFISAVFMLAVIMEEGEMGSLHKTNAENIKLQAVGTTTVTMVEEKSIENVAAAKNNITVYRSANHFKALETNGMVCNISEPKYVYTAPAATYTSEPGTPTSGVLTASGGVNYNANGNKETYYNLDMGGVVSNAYSMGVTGEYWVRDDGVKMLGDYVMVAACYDVYPKGSLVDTSLGTGIVVDTGGFAESNPYQLDIAVSW
ncbi:MAG: hypothetical protein NC393_10625 [Clostridium sp.]|nr:hypothetical protein [Clostridium sp.]MCM1172562.1 hypothetical protein [Clostridium sp.]MCM1209550.1 hypothetical protein [Ruminococcus sp.]